MASFQDRVVGAMRLQASSFEEVEHDQTASSQAAIVVVAAAISGAVGVALWFSSYLLSGVVASVVFALISWGVGSAVVWQVGTRLFPGRNTEADYGQVLRAMGFAQAPGVFGVLRVIPILGWLISPVVAIWTIAAMVVAIRQALDYDDTLKAVIVAVVAWVIMVIVSMIVGFMGFGPAMYPGGPFSR